MLYSLSMPAPAWAVSDDDAFVLNGTGQKFYALPSDRKGGASLSQEKPNEIKELKRGFIALDRNRDGGPRRVTSVRNQVNTVRGTQEDRDILSLFENELDKRPAASGQTAINHKWPVAASASQHMSSGYGMRKDPFHGQMRFHGGLDIAAAAGTPILASADGRVKETGYRAGFGNYVTLLHSDGSESMYSHLQKAEARLGTMVRQGQEIGKLGSTGRSTGPHLHYEVLMNGVQVNPKSVKVAIDNSLKGNELKRFKETIRTLNQQYAKQLDAEKIKLASNE